MYVYVYYYMGSGGEVKSVAPFIAGGGRYLRDAGGVWWGRGEAASPRMPEAIEGKKYLFPLVFSIQRR